MTYREMLNEFKKQQQFNLLTLIIADEVDCIVQSIDNDEDFNTICSIVENAYLKSDNLSVANIACAIDNLLHDDDCTMEELKQMSKWDIISKASDLA